MIEIRADLEKDVVTQHLNTLMLTMSQDAEHMRDYNKWKNKNWHKDRNILPTLEERLFMLQFINEEMYDFFFSDKNNQSLDKFEDLIVYPAENLLWGLHQIQDNIDKYASGIEMRITRDDSNKISIFSSFDQKSMSHAEYCKNTESIRSNIDISYILKKKKNLIHYKMDKMNIRKRKRRE